MRPYAEMDLAGGVRLGKEGRPGPFLVFSGDAWEEFLEAVKAGEYDLAALRRRLAKDVDMEEHA